MLAEEERFGHQDVVGRRELRADIFSVKVNTDVPPPIEFSGSEQAAPLPVAAAVGTGEPEGQGEPPRLAALLRG